MNATPVSSGNFSKLKVVRGILREYTNADKKLELHFEFNPSTITRTRSVEINFGEGQATTGGRDFHDPSEVWILPCCHDELGVDRDYLVWSPIHDESFHLAEGFLIGHVIHMYAQDVCPGPIRHNVPP